MRGGDRAEPAADRHGALSGPARHGTVGLSRNLVFAGLAAIGFANGVSHRVLYQLRDDAAGALLGTFEISILVWVALVVATVMIAAGPARPASGRDLAVAGTALAAFTAPAPPLAWLALTGLGLYLAATAAAGSRARRGAWILVALTVPMFWSRLAMALLSDIILRVDGFLVGLMLWTERTGNAVAFADGWGYFWIAPGCSSLAGASLAVLCWVLLSQSLEQMRGLKAWHCAAVVLCVVALNTLRMGLTGLSRQHYEVIHSPLGNAVFGFVLLAAMVGIFLGVGRMARGRGHAAAH